MGTPSASNKDTSGRFQVIFRDVFLHAHFWLALGAAGQRWWIGEVGPSTNWQGILGAACAVIAGYGYLRLLRAAEPDLVPSPHIRWVRDHRSGLMATVGIAGGGALFLLKGQHLVFGSWSLLVPVFAAVYLLPWRNASDRSIGLREIPGLKVVLVALTWTFITCGMTDTAPWGHRFEQHAWMAALQFGYFLALAIAFDIGDLNYDRPGLRTVPQSMGVGPAKALAVLLLLPWCGFLSMVLLISHHPIEPGWREPGWDMGYLLPLFGMLITGVAVAGSGPQRPRWYYTALLDGMLLLVPLLAWIGSRC